MPPTEGNTAEPDRFVHRALFYRSAREYLDGLVPFVRDGLRDGEPVAAAVPGGNLDRLRAALGPDAARVHLLDMTVAGRNPGRIIAGVLRAFADAHPDRHVRIIGEPIWPGRTATEYPACAQHEALINLAFTGRDVTIACPYDSARLEPHVLADAEATHPLLWDLGQRRVSARYAPTSVVERYNLSLNHTPPGASTHTVTTIAALGETRRLIGRQGMEYDLTADQVADLEMIATELVTNSLVYTNGAADLRLWQDDRHVVCEVADGGRLLDPLAGRRPAAPGQTGGRGLLLVNEFADLVRTHTSEHGTTIRAYLRRTR